MMGVYYNENDPKAADWLEALIAQGLLPAGRVDRRSIEEVTPEDLEGFAQCHFFAGIGGWPLALAMAGIPTTTPIWTGSCPCQPFSQCGTKRGSDDTRHLFPTWARLIAECKPAVVFGEQVASPLGRDWLGSVLASLEELGYRGAGADLCAAGVGAPHIRQRLYWVAHAADGDWRGRKRGAQAGPGQEGERGRGSPGGGSLGGDGLGHAEGERRGQGRLTSGDGAQADDREQEGLGSRHAGEGGHLGWERVEWVFCEDARARPFPEAQPALFPLAHGLPGRVGVLRGAGNAIVPQVAAVFVAAALEA